MTTRNSPETTAAPAASGEKLPRKRCLTCNKFFQPVRPWQKFCPPRAGEKSSKCKDDFHNHGSAYGKLRDTLTKLIHKTVREQLRGIVADELEKLTKRNLHHAAEVHDVIEGFEDRLKRAEQRAKNAVLKSEIGGAEGIGVIIATVNRRRLRAAAIDLPSIDEQIQGAVEAARDSVASRNRHVYENPSKRIGAPCIRCGLPPTNPIHSRAV